MASSRLFSIEQLDLQFSNGVRCSYERLAPRLDTRSVMIFPILDATRFLLIREYAAGTEDYVLGFPKGGVAIAEDCAMAANRELMEEAGYRARKLSYLTGLASSPSYSNHVMEVYIGNDLVPEKLPGDEPEPMEVIPWRFDAIDALLAREDFIGVRDIAVLLLVWKQRLHNHQNHHCK